ncbi:hypothetical protein SNE40_014423 [Patella caerulea]|uniref:CUB domain-containing protein n=1 Tax=Patella caerulea TaxID=87958 RepID=A0AAN8PCV3_PATCE
MAATRVVCYIFLITFVAVSEGTECRHDTYVELSANSKSKFIYSPNYPEPYPAHAMCKWRIRIESQSRSKIIHVRTMDMEVPTKNDNCTNTYLKAYDGQYNTAPLIKQWCDDSTIVSSGAYVIIEFHASHLSGKGFALSFHEINTFSHKCKAGGVQKIDLTQTPLVISFPDEDAFKNGNGDCEWLFAANKMDSKIIVELDEWILDPSSDFCNNSYIQFIDGDNSNSSLEILKYCHPDRPFHTLTTSIGYLLVRLHGNWQNTATQLPIITLKLHSIKINNPMIDCHSNLQTLIIDSTPSLIVYPPGKLQSEEDPCPLQLWSDNKEETVRVDVVSNIDDNITCQHYLYVYNSTETENVIPYRCINDKPSYFNPGHIKILKPYDRDNITEKVVFRAYTVASPCDGSVLEQWAHNDDRKTLKLAGSKDVYDNNGYCKYLLKAEDEDGKIKLFVSGSLFEWDHGDVNCENDFIALYDGTDEDAPMISKWCGGSAPDGFHSTGKNMLVIFRSNQHGRQHQHQYNIEYLAYKEMCSKYDIPLNASSSPQNLTSPGYPDYYPPDSVCNWSIRPSSNEHHIVLKVTNTRLGPHCNSMLSTYEYKEMTNSDTTELIGRACDSETPTFISSRGPMMVQFRSNKFWNVGGFLAEYWEEPMPTPAASVHSSSNILKSCYTHYFIIIICVILYHR